MRALSLCLLGGVLVLPAMAQDLTLNGNSRRERVDCGGRNVVVTGNSNEYVLAGGCRAVSVNVKAFSPATTNIMMPRTGEARIS